MVISVENAKQGMILSKDVFISNGNMFIRNQKTLTPEIIQLLKKHHIEYIEIYENSDTENKGNIQKDSSTQRNFPQIEVKISEDAMNASMIIEQSGENTADITHEYLFQILKENGICFGVEESVLKNIVEQWNKNKKRSEFEHIAQGIYPKSYPLENNIGLLVQCVSNKDDFDKIRNYNNYWEIAEITPNVQRVKPGMVIAQIQSPNPSYAGKNIKGEQIFSTDSTYTSLVFENGVELSANNDQIIAKSDGLAFFFNNTIGIQELNFDGFVDVVVSPDKMKAYLKVYPGGIGGKMPDEMSIRKLLKQKGVVFGIIEDNLKKLLTDFENSIYTSENFLIAQGTDAVKGKDGIVEFLFKRETSLKPQRNPDGSVDYKNVNIINAVSAKQKLATLHPPQKGIPGKNVLGQEMPCLDGVAAKLPSGKNTLPAPQNPDCLIAAIDGIVRFNGSNVEVFEGFIVPGDIDYSTGNIEYEKSVVVNGDVKSGFSINCGGDLQVKGTIEDCSLNIGGNVLCKFGFIGQGKGIIDSKGDVNLGFMKNQIVKSRKSVNIAKEALNCSIFAKYSITVHGKPISVAGGNLMARDSITVHSVGNHSNIRTLLEIGTDFSLLEELDKTQQQINELSSNFQKLSESYKKFENIITNKKSFPEKNQALILKLTESIQKHKQQMDLLKQRERIIQNKVYSFSSAFISFKHALYPGTIIKIGERNLLIKEEVLGPKKVIYVNNEIKFI